MLERILVILDTKVHAPQPEDLKPASVGEMVTTEGESMFSLAMICPRVYRQNR
jgi:hypothetical protein